MIRDFFPGFEKIELVEELIFLMYFREFYTCQFPDKVSDFEITDEMISDGLKQTRAYQNYEPLITQFSELLKNNFRTPAVKLKKDKSLSNIYNNSVDCFVYLRNPIADDFELGEDGRFSFKGQKFMAHIQNAEDKAYSKVIRYSLANSALSIADRASGKGANLYTGISGDANVQTMCYLMAAYVFMCMFAKFTKVKLIFEFPKTSYTSGAKDAFMRVFSFWDYKEKLYFNFKGLKVDFKYESSFGPEINYFSLLNYYNQQNGIIKDTYLSSDKYELVQKNMEIGDVCILYTYRTSSSKTKSVLDINQLEKHAAEKIVILQNFDENHIAFTSLEQAYTVEKTRELLKRDIDQRNLSNAPDTVYCSSSPIPKSIHLPNLKVLNTHTEDYKSLTFTYDLVGVCGAVSTEKHWLVPLGPLHENLNLSNLKELTNPCAEVMNGEIYILPPYEHIYTLLKEYNVQFNEKKFYDNFLRAELKESGRTKPIWDELHSEKEDTDFVPISL